MKLVLLDTNVLLLHILGTADPANIGRHKRIDSFSDADFANLQVLMRSATGFVTLPYILAETSNWLRIGQEDSRAEARVFAAYVQSASEIAVESKPVISHPYFYKIGITDTAIAHFARDRIQIITVDFKLYGLLRESGILATNLRHMTPLT